MAMNFRSRHIADSVTERITAIAESIRTGASMPAPRGAAVVSLNRSENGDLMVTKTFDNGETELLTISNQEPSSTQPPDGLVQISGNPNKQPAQDTLSAGIDSGNIVQSAALGGDSLDALLRT